MKCRKHLSVSVPVPVSDPHINKKVSVSTMEIPIAYGVLFLLINNKKIIILSLLITRIRDQYVVLKFQTDRMRIKREYYEYHEQTKQTSQLGSETKNVDLLRCFVTESV
jgi:hypothetical protein